MPQSPALPPGTTQRTLSIIMGGGAGTRLFPLTKDRSKPAVPLGGKYRLVDIPISNCLNSGLRSIYVLTQFNSMSLHRHIQASYKFDNFSRSFVDILAAQQTPEGAQWYQGTADAVRQNLRYFLEQPYDYFLILSGDQLYRMDFRTLLHQHIRSGAEITLATTPVQRAAASDFGIMLSKPDHRITRFEEKPKEAALLDELKLDRQLLESIGSNVEEELFEASMGIYVFNRQVLVDCLDSDLDDFGKHVIPKAIGDRHVNSYIFKGYWEDIGTIRAFYEANLDLTDLKPQYSFFEATSPIYTHPRFLAGEQNQRRDLAPGDHLGRLHYFRCPHRAERDRRAQHHPERGDDPQQRDHGGRPFRGRGPGAIRRRAPDWDWAQLRDRSRDYRQERAHRGRRRHHAGRQGIESRRGKLLHPRWDRRRAEGCGDPGGLLDLNGAPKRGSR